MLHMESSAAQYLVSLLEAAPLEANIRPWEAGCTISDACGTWTV